MLYKARREIESSVQKQTEFSSVQFNKQSVNSKPVKTRVRSSTCASVSAAVQDSEPQLEGPEFEVQWTVSEGLGFEIL